MSGLRVHHPTERSCVVVLAHPGYGLKRSQPKDIAVHLDENGDAIVSEGVWRQMQEAEASGLTEPQHFVILNEVKDPPTLMVGGQAPETRAIRSTNHGREELVALAQQFAPPGVKARVTRPTKKGSENRG